LKQKILVQYHIKNTGIRYTGAWYTVIYHSLHRKGDIKMLKLYFTIKRGGSSLNDLLED
jgi:hypothetical protein